MVSDVVFVLAEVIVKVVALPVAVSILEIVILLPLYCAFAPVDKSTVKALIVPVPAPAQSP